MCLLALPNYAARLDDPAYCRVRNRLEVKALSRGLRRLEEVLVIGNWLYDSVRLIEHNWRTEVIEGKTPYDPEEARTIREFLAQWVQPCRRCLDEINLFESKGFEVRGSKEFKRHCAEAVDILGGHNPFFEDADKAGRWAALTAKHRVAIRPVEVDESGRIFERTGERFTMPGLEPTDILEAIEDEHAGRVRPLREIVASRGQHGI
jgi:hypothetical protein